MYRASYRAAWLSALFLPTVQVVSAVALGVIVRYGGFQAEAGLLTIGGIYAFVSYLTFIMWPIQDLARVYAEMQHSIASAERIFKLLDTEPEVRDRPARWEATTLLGEIVFENVALLLRRTQAGADELQPAGAAGRDDCHRGLTGGGKSTIVNLLCRFYEPRSGRILINGRDYTEYTLQSIHSKIGIVLQTPHLFSGTVRENIRYGRLSASDEEVEEAARIAGAHEFILTLEKATTRTWARAAACSRWGKSSSSAWRGLCWQSRNSSSWTRPPPAWIR